MTPAAEFGDAAPHSAGMPAKSVQFLVQMVILGTFLLDAVIFAFASYAFGSHFLGTSQVRSSPTSFSPWSHPSAWFSLVKCMFGKDQLSNLGDQLQGSVMLRYNRRNVG